MRNYNERGGYTRSNPPLGLSRFSDVYRDLNIPYGERVRLEQSLSRKDIQILNFINEKEVALVSEMEGRLGDVNLDRLLKKEFVKRKGQRYTISPKGVKILEEVNFVSRRI